MNRAGLVAIWPVSELKAHEETIPERVERIQSEILESGKVVTPLWVDLEHRIVLNGHHRLAALKNLGCHSAPVLFVDYDDSNVTVGICPGAQISEISKEEVVQAALSGPLFPPRSSLHALQLVEPDFQTPLSLLRKISAESLSR